MAGAKAYEAEIARIEAGGAAQIVIDMSTLEFMDSTGLRLLLETDMRSREGSGPGCATCARRARSRGCST